MDSKDATGKPAVGQVESHMAGGKYQPCRWSGSAWVPVAAARIVLSISGICPRCHSYCQGDCLATR